jgi:hypothetical protein
MFNVSIEADENVLVTIGGAVDSKGNPQPLGGTLVFTSADESIVKVLDDPAGDPNSKLLSAVGPLSSAAIVSVTDGVLTDNIAVEIKVGDEAAFAFAAGTPFKQ